MTQCKEGRTVVVLVDVEAVDHVSPAQEGV